MEKINVKNSGWIILQSFNDGADGKLIIAESGRSIPFQIKRVYYINHLQERSAVRGKHAHKKLEQVIFCVNGSFDLGLDDGKDKQIIKMDDPAIGILLGRSLWHTMTNFSADCVILVFANDFYDESDYIRSYDDFLKYIKDDDNPL